VGVNAESAADQGNRGDNAECDEQLRAKLHERWDEALVRKVGFPPVSAFIDPMGHGDKGSRWSKSICNQRY
jgi:hypothetical protein